METAIVHLSDILLRGMGFGFAGDYAVPPIDPPAWDLLGLHHRTSRVSSWRQKTCWTEVWTFRCWIEAGQWYPMKTAVLISHDTACRRGGENTPRVLPDNPLRQHPVGPRLYLFHRSNLLIIDMPLDDANTWRPYSTRSREILSSPTCPSSRSSTTATTAGMGYRPHRGLRLEVPHRQGPGRQSEALHSPGRSGLSRSIP